MAYLSFQELEAKYGLTPEQKAKIKQALNKELISYRIVEEPVTKVTGKDLPIVDTKISVLKCDEDDVKKFLEIS
jgi:hypothetical protein